MRGDEPRTEPELRLWASRQLGSDVLDKEWEVLRERSYLEEALRLGDDEYRAQTREYLMAFLRDVRAIHAAHQDRDTGSPLIPAHGTAPVLESAVGDRLIPLTERENWRAALLSNLLARMVRRSAALTEHRERYLAGHYGTVDGARRFVRDLLEAPAAYESKEHAVELERIATSLTEQLPWDFADAAVFVLAGEQPWVEPIRAWTEARDFPRCNDGRVVLEIAPWVSDETVAATYRSLRTMLVGRANRGLSDRAETVLRFVMNESDHWPPTATDWPVLFEAWQRTHGARYPYANKYKLKQAYQHAEARLLRSAFAFPWPEGHAVPHGMPRRVRYKNPGWGPSEQATVHG